MIELGFNFEISIRHGERLWVASEEFKVMGNKVWRRCTVSEEEMINTWILAFCCKK